MLLMPGMLGLSEGKHDRDFKWMGSCCGETDCKQAMVAVMMFGKDKTKVMIDSVEYEVDSQRVKETQDGHMYVCLMKHWEKVREDNIRCVFYKVGA